MEVCDICNAAGLGTIIKAADMSRAVRGGFNPFKEGLTPDVLQVMGLGGSQYDTWREVALDGPASLTDWNVCATCLPRLQPYLGKTTEKSRETHSCAFCGKIVDPSDNVAILDESVVAKIESLSGLHRRGGASILDPAGRLRWVVCTGCMKQMTETMKGFPTKQ